MLVLYLAIAKPLNMLEHQYYIIKRNHKSKIPYSTTDDTDRKLPEQHYRTKYIVSGTSGTPRNITDRFFPPRVNI